MTIQEKTIENESEECSMPPMPMESCRAVNITQNSPAWLEWRNGGIGGSEIAAIVGASKWGTALSVWAKKTGIAKDEVEENGNMEWGHRLENAVTDKWMDEHTDYTLEIRGPVFERIDMPWMRASLDNIVVAPDGTMEALECKTASSDDDWIGPDGEELIPESYCWQAVWQMAVTGLRKVRFSVLVMGNRKRSWLERTLEWDDQYVDFAIAKGREFWNMVETQTPPGTSEMNPDADAIAIRSMFPVVDESNTIELGSDFERYVGERTILKMQLKGIEKQIDTIENIVKLAMKDAKVATVGGEKFVSASSSVRESIDTKAIKAQMPEIAKQFIKSTPVKTYRFAG